MEDNKTTNTAGTTPSTPVKAAVKKTVAAKKATTATAKTAVPKAVETPKPTTFKETAKPKAETSTIQKVIKTGKRTGQIAVEAGSIILGSSILTTKAIAGLTTKAGKKAFEIGKDLITDTTKEVKKSQQTVVKASKTAIKETVETIKDSNIIENPLKKKK